MRRVRFNVKANFLSTNLKYVVLLLHWMICPTVQIPLSPRVQKHIGEGGGALPSSLSALVGDQDAVPVDG